MKAILATGVVDELPAIPPGLTDLWGTRAFFCPYCDGYELGMGRLGVLATSATAAHFAVLVSEWAATGQTTFLPERCRRAGRRCLGVVEFAEDRHRARARRQHQS